ncbi:pyridoxamine 5'-phosphate oxidase family protein [Maritalea sp.]|jgi:PPOX class probable FMN-dependent enzyme|uniref:pyridoxamine 5'-phosphate oxidase family protein n=1 Tax=Maritalea sp. TaxID=2003361 RepID=UPI0039E640FA
MQFISSVEELARIYGQPSAPSLVKEIDYVADVYAQFIALSPFVGLATVAQEGIDCSPRGDKPGFVRIADQKTLIMPDRRGNNRIDSLRNIVRDPRTSFMFLIPGSSTILRANGKAQISVDTQLLASFAVEEKAPRSAIVLKIDKIYFQCARAIIRSGLWDEASKTDPNIVPTAGQMLAAMTNGEVGGKVYDDEWPERAQKSMW